MTGKLMRQHEARQWLLSAHASASEDACILWPKGVDKDGYGQTIWMVNGVKKWIRLHRFSLELAIGPSPEGKPFALHSCHNPRCINPLHLRWGTCAENNKDRDDACRGKKSRLTLSQVELLSVARGKERKLLAESFGISYAHARTLVLQLRRGVVSHLR